MEGFSLNKVCDFFYLRFVTLDKEFGNSTVLNFTGFVVVSFDMFSNLTKFTVHVSF